MELNALETLLLHRAEMAEALDCNAPGIKPIADEQTIRGEAIRAILFGLSMHIPGEAAPRVARLTGFGLQVIGARISGRFDLSHGTAADGSAMAYLGLTSCDFEQAIYMSSAWIRGVSLVGSYFCHLCAEAVRIEGGLDLGGVRSNEVEGAFTGAGGLGQCWVQLHGAHISGEVDLAGAHLTAPLKRDNYEPDVMASRHALELRHSHIGGSLVLSPDVRAVGGVNVRLSHIDGNVWANGIFLSAVEGAAFSASAANIRGDLNFNPVDRKEMDTIRSEIEGRFSLYGARITGDLRMSGACVIGAFTAESAEIGGAVILETWGGRVGSKPKVFTFECTDEVRFYDARITSNLEMDGASVAGDIVGQGLTVGGIVFMRAASVEIDDYEDTVPFHCKGDVILSMAQIGNNLNMAGARLEGDLLMPDTMVSGDIVFCAWNSGAEGQERIFPFHCSKNITLRSTKIDGSLVFYGADVEGDINAIEVDVGLDVLAYGWNGKIDGQEETIPFICNGVMNFYGAKIGSSLSVGGGTVKGGMGIVSAEISGMVLLATSVGKKAGQDTVFPLCFQENVSFENTRIARDLKV
ncbi:MAG: hypothetical protein QM667_11895, partial [Asticcacaulis sp.]